MGFAPASGLWPLTGRDEELDLLTEAFASIGDYVGVAIVGSAGVGKSRLTLEAAAAAANAGATVRWATGTHSARTIPLGAFSEWTTGVGENALQLVTAVIGALTSVADSERVVIAVDDAHLLDDLSAFVVHQLALRRGATVIVSIRRGEPVPDAVTALWKDRHLRLLELQPLSHHESDMLLERGLRGPVDAECSRRMWELTRGNVLYLRHLVDQELTAGRLMNAGGRWVWTGAPVVSPTLSELIDSHVGSVPDAVLDAVDLVAVSEPLDMSLLTRIVDTSAVEAAERLGLIRIVPARNGTAARIGHPLYGEIRRNHSGQWRLRRLRGLVAAASADLADTDADAVVRLGVLWLESDLAPNPTILLRAAQAAVHRLDLHLTERLADAAHRAGGSADAAILRAHALNLLGRAQEAEELLRTFDTATLNSTQSANLITVRAANFLWPLGRPDTSWELIDSALREANFEVRQSVRAFRAIQLAMAGRPAEAIATGEAIDLQQLPDLPALFAIWALVISFGDVGRVACAARLAEEGYRRANQSRDAPYQGIGLAEFHVMAMVLAGCIPQAVEVAAAIQRQCAEVPGISHAVSTAIGGMAALGQGDLVTARQCLSSAMPVLVQYGDTSAVCYRFTIVAVEVLARLGDVGAASDALADMNRRRHPAFGFIEADRLLSTAWFYAATGALTPAIATAQRAACYARSHGQLAREVMCLQAATQFGDKGTAARLQELQHLEGPRAGVAAAFAAGLAADDADALMAASTDFETMGDLFAAADAAAHAANVLRKRNHPGASLTAAGRAQRVAASCGGAVSPAVREAAQPLPFSRREREIISLVAQGLSNKEVADALGISVRTIEGHLYRASMKSGGISRAELCRLLGEFDPR